LLRRGLVVLFGARHQCAARILSHLRRRDGLVRV
jgi:hypothetical protein